MPLKYFEEWCTKEIIYTSLVLSPKEMDISLSHHHGKLCLFTNLFLTQNQALLVKVAGAIKKMSAVRADG